MLGQQREGKTEGSRKNKNNLEWSQKGIFPDFKHPDSPLELTLFLLQKNSIAKETGLLKEESTPIHNIWKV